MSTLAGALRVPVPAGARMRIARPRPLAVAIALIVVAVVVSHGYNMLHFPYLEDDEGTYFSQGWAVFHVGRLAPYTYFYDHAPLGWIQLGMWQELTGNLSFGYAIASGRVFMLLTQLGSALLVFGIGRRSTGQTWVGLLAATVFSLSAYGIFFHRRILLDNIATFWLLLSVYMLVGQVTLRRVWVSALALGIAVLSKEIALAAAPALAVLLYRQSPRPSRPFAVAGWLGLSIGVCSIYVLLALLKGELFPAGSGGHPHVSLMCSLRWQASRGSGGGLTDTSSAFWHMTGSWAHTEPLLVIWGTAAALASVVLLRRNRVASMIGWTVLLLWLFLARGGSVLSFYLLPLMPLLALSLALVVHAGVQRARRVVPAHLAKPAAAGALATVVAICGLLVFVGYQRSAGGLWTSNPVRGQLQAVGWIRHHLAPSSRIVIDQYMWNELHHPPQGGPRYADAQYYWKAGADPQVQKQGFDGNWREVQYVIATPQLVSDTAKNGFPIVAPALEHSRLVASFDTGWRVDIRQVDPSGPAQFSLPRATPEPVPGCMRAA